MIRLSRVFKLKSIAVSVSHFTPVTSLRLALRPVSILTPKKFSFLTPIVVTLSAARQISNLALIAKQYQFPLTAQVCSHLFSRSHLPTSTLQSPFVLSSMLSRSNLVAAALTSHLLSVNLVSPVVVFSHLSYFSVTVPFTVSVWSPVMSYLVPPLTVSLKPPVTSVVDPPPSTVS